jgi:hypothetical protein
MTLDQMPDEITSIQGDGNVPVPVCVASVANDISHNVENVVNIGAAVSVSLLNAPRYIEYLESNGSQLLDTGVLSTSNISYEIQYTVIGGGPYNYQCIIGSENFHNSFYPYCWDNANRVASGEYVAYSHDGVEWANLGTDLQGVKTTLKKTGNLFQLSAENGFSKELRHQSNASFSLTTTMNIFGMSAGVPDYCVAKLYYCKIWDGDTLVRDFVPMQHIDGQRGLFDKVTNEFYTMQ